VQWLLFAVHCRITQYVTVSTWQQQWWSVLSSPFAAGFCGAAGSLNPGTDYLYMHRSWHHLSDSCCPPFLL
jgi:hypothetical protein